MQSPLSLVGEQLVQAMTARGRPPSEWYAEDGVDVILFDPPLTVEEQATFDALSSLSRSAVQVTPEEWAGLQTEIDGLRTYHGLATPTNAQSVAAIKAIIRVLRAILRD
jgi:hypothetical protein